ncbi:hypothetical protein HK105_203862 [Polyrhizophydium stewartii]|uniref:Adenylate cyclase n=1 Tax=Polyrhizophydium stewartii TaxID=2732419 RepID=A0ABR4NA76_9FUNG|nr:hypothetical protein HK105_002014 [Polyrhizophydium stewartii]
MRRNDGDATRKPSYLSSLRKLPLRLRGKPSGEYKSDSSLPLNSPDKRGSSSAGPRSSQKPGSQTPPAQRYAQQQPEGSEETETTLGTISVHDDTKKRLVLPTTLQTASSSSAQNADPNCARLVYLTSYGGKMQFPLADDETTIGRKDDNHIVLTDPKISKFHASIVRTDSGHAIIDHNSSNGVKVNEEAIVPATRRPLRAGDTIMIGSIRLVYYDRDQAAGADGAASDADGKGTGSQQMTGSRSTDDKVLKLVTILPSENKYDEQIAIKAELAAEEEIDFRKAEEIENVAMLREDYEKLRVAYELSKITLTHDIMPHIQKSLELIFEILPVDRGVVLLVDKNTGQLATHHVKLREGFEDEGKEILLSSTILKLVYESRKCLITTDASKDQALRAAASVMHGQIRSVICVPLIAHNKVHGILHLDSTDRITRFSNKDLSIVKAISNQTAIAIENSILMSEFEANARLNEQLSRFLAPQVVKKMANRSEIIRRSGRQMVGTVIFVDIRGFTNFSERSEPVEVVHLLNDYFERLVRIVFRYNGVIDKYIGDALMAVFGTLDDDVDAEFRAVAAAFEFKKAVKDMNEDRKRQGKEDTISIGVGVNTGELVVGFIGSSQRLEYTCIGDSVNTSSRVCSMAKHDQVLISEFTYKYVADRIESVAVGSRQFKGKQKEVLVYEVLAIKHPKSDAASVPASLAADVPAGDAGVPTSPSGGDAGMSAPPAPHDGDGAGPGAGEGPEAPMTTPGEAAPPAVDTKAAEPGAAAVAGSGGESVQAAPEPQPQPQPQPQSQGPATADGGCCAGSARHMCAME